MTSTAVLLRGSVVTVDDAVAILAEQGGIDEEVARVLLETLRLPFGRSIEELSRLVGAGDISYTATAATTA
jgi:hypothetical protein